MVYTVFIIIVATIIIYECFKSKQELAKQLESTKKKLDDSEFKRSAYSNEIKELATKIKSLEIERSNLLDKAETYSNELDQLKRKTHTVELERAKYQKEVASFAKEVEHLTNSLREAEAELDFYTNIEEASVNLNDHENEEANQDILDQAIHQIQVARMQAKPDGDNLNYLDVVGEPLDKEQFSACIEMENTLDNFFITGKAGTGKSLLLNVFKNTTKKNNIVLAPTGIAALNVGGATIHSAFGYFNLTSLNIDDIKSNTIRLSSDKRMILKLVSTIIIDEISMVRVDILERLDLILKAVNNNDLPFGGKQMLIFGDLFQLPPVAIKPEKDYLDRYGGIHFFFSNAYKNGNFRFF